MEGADRIFFGEGYSLAQIADGSGIEDNVGNVAVLEILFQEVDGNLELYVETETFGGNVTGAASEIVTITLVGFSANDITGFADGFLTAGTAIV